MDLPWFDHGSSSRVHSADPRASHGYPMVMLPIIIRLPYKNKEGKTTRSSIEAHHFFFSEFSPIWKKPIWKKKNKLLPDGKKKKKRTAWVRNENQTQKKMAYVLFICFPTILFLC